jgi:hypothetical protein
MSSVPPRGGTGPGGICHLLGRHQLGIQHCLRAERRQLEYLRLTLDLTTEQGKISVSASVTDKAGNTASDSIDNETLDTVAPLAAGCRPPPAAAAITGLFNTGLDANGGNALSAGQDRWSLHPGATGLRQPEIGTGGQPV